MKTVAQRAELQKRIWQIANDVRGSIDGWGFKQYVLGTLFYRFISEYFALYMEGGENFRYADISDDAIRDEIKDEAVKTKGYFIYPSELFENVVRNCEKSENLNTTLAKIFSNIENSAIGYPSEEKIKGLFADFDTTSNKLGSTVKEEIKHFSKNAILEEIRENDYNLSVNSYVEIEDTREKIDIKRLNEEIKERVKKIDKLRGEIDKIVAEIESE